MSDPTPQPYTPTDSWRSEPPLPPQTAPSGPPPQFGQMSPPLPRQNNGLAIAALVLASVALLVGLGTVLTPLTALLFIGAAGAGGGGFPSTSDGQFKGTAPQVVAGRAYPGALLQDEVSRVVRGDGGDVTSMSCPATPQVLADAVTTCHGVVDGSHWDLRLTFDDGAGHFTLDEKLS